MTPFDLFVTLLLSISASAFAVLTVQLWLLDREVRRICDVAKWKRQ
jgi:hypothetical protein